MEITLPSAKQSPRIEDGALKWYAGDCFSITLSIELTDQNGAPVEIAPSDRLDITFVDGRKARVKTFTFTGIEDNAVTLLFDAVTTALFPAGAYRYDVYYIGTGRSTIANNNRVLVEE